MWLINLLAPYYTSTFKALVVLLIVVTFMIAYKSPWFQVPYYDPSSQDRHFSGYEFSLYPLGA